MNLLQTEVAIRFEPGWGIAQWSAAAAILIAAGTLAAVGPGLFRLLDDFGWPAWAARGLAGVLAVAAGIVALLAPGRIFRHIDQFKYVVVVALITLAVAGAIAIAGMLQERWDPALRTARFVGAGVLGVGVVYGFAVDGLNRWASSIPTTVGTLLLLIGAGGAYAVVKARE
jgi:hypothetical protein